MIERALIQGFKCLRKVEVDLAPFVVLIGPNDSGKTSFLQALLEPWAAVGGLWSARQRGDVLSRKGKVVVRCIGSNASAEVTWNDTRSVCQFTAHGAEVDARDFQRAAQESVKPVPEFDLGPELRALRPSGPLILDARRIPERAGSGSGTLPQLVANGGAGTVAQLARLALADRKNYETIQQELRTITNGRVQEFVIIDQNGAFELLFRMYDGTMIEGREISAGLLMYLGFLAIIHRQDAPGVLLIEEPENGLHPLRLYEVVSLLRRLTERGAQVIMTTHSPDLLNACRPEEVRVFRRPEPDSGTEVHALPADFDRIAMRQTVGEIWAARGEEGLLDMLPRVKPLVQTEEP